MSTWWPGDRMCISSEVGVIDEPVSWTNDKPYLIIDYLYVDSLASLTIEPGVTVYMHYNALLYVDGTLEVMGSLEEPVTFQGDRLEEFYKDKPGQWRFIYLSAEQPRQSDRQRGNHLRNHGGADQCIA